VAQGLTWSVGRTPCNSDACDNYSSLSAAIGSTSGCGCESRQHGNQQQSWRDQPVQRRANTLAQWERSGQQSAGSGAQHETHQNTGYSWNHTLPQHHFHHRGTIRSIGHAYSNFAGPAADRIGNQAIKTRHRQRVLDAILEVTGARPSGFEEVGMLPLCKRALHLNIAKPPVFDVIPMFGDPANLKWLHADAEREAPAVADAIGLVD
jgi:hypothetical protein